MAQLLENYFQNCFQEQRKKMWNDLIWEHRFRQNIKKTEVIFVWFFSHKFAFIAAIFGISCSGFPGTENRLRQPVSFFANSISFSHFSASRSCADLNGLRYANWSVSSFFSFFYFGFPTEKKAKHKKKFSENLCNISPFRRRQIRRNTQKSSVEILLMIWRVWNDEILSKLSPNWIYLNTKKDK